MEQVTNPLRSVRSEVLRSFRPRTVDFEELDDNLLTICGENLRQLRNELGWTQAQSGAVMSVSASQYRKYERGMDFMKMGRAALYMQQTGVPFTFLFARSQYTAQFGNMAVSSDLLPFQILCGTATNAQFRAYCHQLSGFAPGAAAIPEALDNADWPEKQAVTADINGYYRMVARGLRNLRDVLGLTQENLADLLNLNVRTYSQYECGSSPSHFNIVQALHLWIATGVPPLWATYGTAFYQMRILQHKRMAWLLPHLQAMKPDERAAMAELARLLRAPVYRQNDNSVADDPRSESAV